MENWWRSVSVVCAVLAAGSSVACGGSSDDAGSGGTSSGGASSGGVSSGGTSSGGTSSGGASSGGTSSGGASSGGSSGAGGGAGSGGSAGLDAGLGGSDSGGSAGLDAGLGGSDGGSDASSGGSGGLPADAGVVGASCKDALAQYPSLPTGVYQIDPDGSGAQPAVSVVCDMTTDGGGWTLALLKNSMDNGNYAKFASGYVKVEALKVTPEEASKTGTGVPALAGWIDLNDFAYTDLVLAGYAAGSEKFRSKPIAKSSLRIKFGQDGYYLYNDVNGYYWCGGAAAYTNNGVGQVSPPAGAPADCKTHTSLGDGWDFGGQSYNTNLTVCGGGSALMTTGPASGFTYYGAPGAAQAFWVR
ncbi:MAG: fibrinogen-like YCDxxxxGGGW domain-containing protein [Polyangiaceae bacterium]